MQLDEHALVSRRHFLCGLGAAFAAGAASRTAFAEQPTPTVELHEASHYQPLEGNKIRCELCPWQCVVLDGKRGTCGVRENRKGRYYTLVYGHPCTINNDPIEKKPFFHVYPGSKALSIATVGCNMDCRFCQNWRISQENPDNFPTPFRTPEQIVRMAQANKSRTIAYTYSEPTIFFEYMLACAKAAREQGIGNVMVSNGFIAEKPLKELCSVMTAIKIDLKAFTERFYTEICHGKLQPVLDTLKRLSDSGVWYEIVLLVIPTLNDNADEIRRMAEWIVKELGPNVPFHLTRFHPQYKLRNLPPTPPATLQKARDAVLGQGCNFVYTGNLPGVQGENTYCPKCGELVVDRHHHTTLSDSLAEGKCPKCGTAIPGVWM
jgi:pyruvate formate lyase activating enzyme